MSRYALEWAKQQRLASVEAKAVLLVLADYAEGKDNACTLNEQRLASDTGIDRCDLPRVIKALEADGLLVATNIPRPVPANTFAKAVRPYVDEAWGDLTRFTLPIPEHRRDWGVRHAQGCEGDMAQRTAVYRLYDAAGVLLYVGISSRPDKRFEEHRKTKRWWFRVATREITWHQDRYAAEAEEYGVIQHEDPPYNMQHSPSRRAGGDRSKRQAYAMHEESPDAYDTALRGILADLRAGRYDVRPLPSNEVIGKTYGLGSRAVWYLMHELLERRAIAPLPNSSRGTRMHYRPWSEW